MRIKLLGTAAGGGFPQWNCNCAGCREQRLDPERSPPRLQSSIAVQAADNLPWVLVNASPDVRAQLEAHLPLSPDARQRSARVAAILLTDGQLDHATGLLLLRESPTAHTVYCTDSVHDDLTGAFPALGVLATYCGVVRRPLPLDDHAELAELPGLFVRALPLGGKAPPYSPARGRERPDATVALAFTDRASGRSVVYAPALSDLSFGLMPYLSAADVLLVDGTVWYDDDLSRAKTGSKTGRSMGHLPLAGEGGLLAGLRDFPKARKILVHVNNTNPLLCLDSRERQELEESGVELGYDGLEISL